MKGILKFVLLEPGEGWLRWGLAARRTGGWTGEPPEEFTVAPPLRRIWEALKDWRYGYPLRADYETDTAWTYLKDPDRSEGLHWAWTFLADRWLPWRRWA